MAEQPLLKDQLAAEAVEQLVELLVAAGSAIDVVEFKRNALNGLEQLELKQRVQHLIKVLQQYLPSDFEQAAQILFRIGDIGQQRNSDETWGSFTVWPVIDYVAEEGLEHPALSLKLLSALTPLFSAEFAVRPFIEQYFELSHSTMLKWTDDANPHIRRLASEGIRPRLPWGKRLQGLCKNPQPIFVILDKLKDDPSLYVRRSVANNLNDISKDNPDLVIEWCQKWLINATQERQWIIRHGLRSLIKAGRPEVFPLLGYTDKPKVKLSDFQLSANAINLGEQLTIQLTLLSEQSQRLVIDYKIYYMKANGQLSGKVFKWKNVDLAAKQTVSLTKQHSFKPISTRRYYAGQHAVEVLINGKPMDKKTVMIIKK